MAIVKIDSNPRAGVLTPNKAFQVDQKIDDGALDGAQFKGASSGDFAGVTDATSRGDCESGGEYVISTTSDTCAIIYKLE